MIEPHLRERQSTPYNLERTVLLSDLTNTHLKAKKRLKARSKIEQAIGRILARHPWTGTIFILRMASY